VPAARFLRVVTFQADGPESAVDAVLRELVLPPLLEGPSIVDVWIGRSGAGSDRSRVLVTTWLDEPDPDATDDATALAHPRLAALGAVTLHFVEQLHLAVHARFDREEPPRILRIFRGRALPGELGAYVDEARAGMAADAQVNDGLVAFALGTGPDDRVVTVSTWTGWAAIEAATGGDTRHPVATRNARRLASFDVVHLEILPEAPDRARGVGDASSSRGT
jgi:hypothetical protein